MNNTSSNTNAVPVSQQIEAAQTPYQTQSLDLFAEELPTQQDYLSANSAGTICSGSTFTGSTIGSISTLSSL